MEQAFTKGYNSNEKTTKNRIDLLNKIENLPRSISKFVPKIYIGTNFNNLKSISRSRNFPDTIITTQSIILEQLLY